MGSILGGRRPYAGQGHPQTCQHPVLVVEARVVMQRRIVVWILEVVLGETGDHLASHPEDYAANRGDYIESPSDKNAF